jgi:hypothetical protein
MNKPPKPWPFTQRTYPDGAKLVVLTLTPKWRDLCWYNPAKDVNVYLSTLSPEKYNELVGTPPTTAGGLDF